MSQRKSSFKTSVSLLITLLFIVYIYKNRLPILDSLKGISLIFFVVVLIGQVLAQISNSQILKSSLKPLGVKIGNFESYRVTVVSSFVNFFTPVVGGASTKAVYLKSKYNLSYISFASALYANYVITFLISFVFGLIGVITINGAVQTNTGTTLLLFFIGGILGTLFFILFGHKITGVLKKIKTRNKLYNSVLKKLMLADEAWSQIRKDSATVIAILLWSVSLMFSLQLIYWASLSSLSMHSTIGTYMIYAALASVSLLFNLTPGSIGVRETLYASTYKITKISAQDVVAFSLVDRAGQLIVLGTSWVLFGNTIVKNLGKSSKETLMKQKK